MVAGFIEYICFVVNLFLCFSGWDPVACEQVSGRDSGEGYGEGTSPSRAWGFAWRLGVLGPGWKVFKLEAWWPRRIDP